MNAQGVRIGTNARSSSTGTNQQHVNAREKAGIKKIHQDPVTVSEHRYTLEAIMMAPGSNALNHVQICVTTKLESYPAR